jgi:starch synthase
VSAAASSGRRRAEDHFSWESIAEKTVDVYRAALSS